MSYLITGASGFIGSHFHKALAGMNLINLDLAQPHFQHRSLYLKGDIRVEQDVQNALRGRGVKRIISLAAKHHDFGIGHDEYFDTNEGGTRVICKMASEFGIREIVFYSSVAVYGVSERVSSEEQTPTPDSPYGRSKLAGEKVLQMWAAEDPSRSVLIVRPTLVFGVNNTANMFNLIRQIDSGLYFHLGKAQNVKSIAYVDNLVAATIFLMDRIKPGVSIYNYADEPQLTARQIADVIAHALGKRVNITIPRMLGILAGVPFDIAIKLTGKNLPISSARIRKLGTSTHHSAAKIFAEGFRPAFTTQQGLQEMVGWYRRELP